MSRRKDPSEEFETAFLRKKRGDKIEARFRIARFFLFVLLLMVASVAIGWGWGYNVRVSEECDARGGFWFTAAESCVSPEGENIPLDTAPRAD